MDLQGKAVDFLGDSITEGHGVTNPAENRYDNVLMKVAGLKAVHNYGIGGTRIAHQKQASENPRHDLCFCGRAHDLNREASLIVVFGGTNDYGHGDVAFGTDEDTTPNTYCGAVEYLMNLFKTAYAGTPVVFMTPARRWGDEQVSDHPYKAADAKPLAAYVDVIKRKGAAHNIPVLDLYEKLGIDPNKESDRIHYAPDGLHLNDAGQHVLAKCLMEFLETL